MSAADGCAATVVERETATEEAASPTRERTPQALALLRWSRRTALVGWLVLAGLVVWGVTSGTLTSVTRLRETVDGFGPWAPVAYAFLGASESLVPVLPGSATLVAAPLIFGPVVGTLAAYVATCLGSTAVFLLTRHVGADLVTARFRPATVERYLGWLGHPSFPRWFAVAIALPLAPDDLLCSLAGLTPMRLRTFLLVILLLKPVTLVAYTWGVLAVLRQVFPWVAS